MPQREIEIGGRLRDFRESKKVFRTAFAVFSGLGSDKLASYEAGRVPLPYTSFLAINKISFISPKWLVTGEGSPTMGRPLEGLFHGESGNRRELLSAVWDRSLAEFFLRYEDDAVKRLVGPHGLLTELREMEKIVANPRIVRTIPRSSLDSIAETGARLSAQIQELIAGNEFVADLLKKHTDPSG